MTIVLLQSPRPTGPYGALRRPREPYGDLRSLAQPYGTLRRPQGPYGALQSLTGPCGALRRPTGPYGALRCPTGSYGPLRSPTEPCGSARQRNWIVIEIAIGFVTQTLAQIPLTIEATSLIGPLALCMYMHRSTLVYIYIYARPLRSYLSRCFF